MRARSIQLLLGLILCRHSRTPLQPEVHELTVILLPCDGLQHGCWGTFLTAAVALPSSVFCAVLSAAMPVASCTAAALYDSGCPRFGGHSWYSTVYFQGKARLEHYFQGLESVAQLRSNRGLRGGSGRSGRLVATLRGRSLIEILLQWTVTQALC
jgi:hypothetical protein